MRPQPFARQDWGKALTLIPLSPGGWTVQGDDVLTRIADTRDAFAIFAQADALAMPGLERAILLAADAYPDAQIFYGSDAALGERGPERVRLKPAFNQTLLYADDYMGAPLVVRGSALHALGGLRPEMGEAVLYDLVLRAAALGMGIEALPQTLLAYTGARPKVVADDRRRALDARMAHELFEIAPGRTRTTFQIQRLFDAYPDVTLVVPTRQSGPKGGLPYVVELLDSLVGLDWPMERLHVLIGDDSEAADTFNEDRWPFRIRRFATPRPAGEPFSYAAKMNRLWREAETEHLVLLNDDVTVRGAGWLKALMTFAMQTDVGGCGGRLLFPDGRLQHAGMAGGLFGGVTHLWAGQSGDAPTYQDWALVHREWSAVTGAVFATRLAVMEAAGGFDERFSLEYNDVDLCFRLRLMGYRIIYTPFAEGVHREMASRGYSPPDPEQTALFLARWREFLADDPAYHPRLTRTLGNATPADEPDWFDR